MKKTTKTAKKSTVSVKGYDRHGTMVTQFERKGGHVKAHTRHRPKSK